MRDVAPSSGVEIIDTHYLVTFLEKARAKVRADEPSTTGYKNSLRH